MSRVDPIPPELLATLEEVERRGRLPIPLADLKASWAEIPEEWRRQIIEDVAAVWHNPVEEG